MSSERMPQPEGIIATVNKGNESGANIYDKNKDEEGIENGEDRDRDSKSESDKDAAASLGLHRVTERMLKTIKASRDIERNQRKVISKLALKSNGEEEEEEEEGDDEGDEDDNEEDKGNDNGKNNMLEETKKRSIELKASKGTSLKRKKVPPALDLSSCTSGSTTAPNSNLDRTFHSRHTRHGVVESAPPNVLRFSRSATASQPSGKPRVQYLGKTRYPTPLFGYRSKTPYGPRINLPQWQQQQYCPYPYPYAAATAVPVPAPSMLQPYQHPYNYPIPPRSAIPLQMPYYQEYKGYPPYTTTQRKAPQHMTTATTAVNDPEELRNVEPGSNQLMVEDDPTFSSVADDLMHGEIRIQRDVFSFEFAESSPAINKKKFMSICDKVWDESRESSRS